MSATSPASLIHRVRREPALVITGLLAVADVCRDLDLTGADWRAALILIAGALIRRHVMPVDKYGMPVEKAA